MRRVKLDRIDRRILRDLQDNGRMTNVELANRAGISAPPCLRRVRALEEAGFIRGYHAEVAPEHLGFTVTIYAHVGLTSQAEAEAAEAERLNLPVLAQLTVDLDTRLMGDAGTPVALGDGAMAEAYAQLADRFIAGGIV